MYQQADLQDFWIETHGIAAKTMLTLLNHSKLPESDLTKFEEALMQEYHPQLEEMIEHQRSTNKQDFAMPSNAEIVVVPILYKRKTGSVNSTLSDLYLRKINSKHTDDKSSVREVSDILIE